MTEEESESVENIGGSKATAFKIAAVIIPFLLLFLVEAGLRVAGYGSDFPVFIEVDNQPEYVVMNPNVSRKYFFSSGNATSGYQEQFKKNKDPDTFRIFVLGASTGVGYPYYKNGSFHRWLQYGLNETFSDKKFEIINLSLTAVNSYTLLDFTNAVIENKPDAVLIYGGHNEYYGALGVGSVNSLGKYPRLVNAVLSLRDLHIIQLASETYNSIKNQFSNGSDKPETLMKRMVDNQAIAFGSSTYQSGIDQFWHNMNALLLRLNEHNIPTFISTVVSNEKDVAPFISDSSSNEKSAAYHFRKGRQAYQNGDYTSAQSEFVNAKELDMLRFRAPEAINATIRTLANNFPATYLVENEQRFDDASPHGIPGNELLAEHVHPNLQGYSLLAYGFYQSLQEQNPFGLQWENPLTLATLRNQMPITEVDSLQGAYEVKMLKQGWPYNKKESTFKKPETIPQKIAGDLTLKSIDWETAMQRLFQHYQENKSTEKAFKVLEAFNLEHPENAKSYMQTAELALQLNQYTKAERLFARAFRLQESTSMARKIAIKLVRAGRLSSTVSYLDFITTNEPEDYVSERLQKSISIILNTPEPTTSEAQKVKKNMELAKVYQAVGQDKKAADFIDEVLNMDPSNAEAQSLSKQINS